MHKKPFLRKPLWKDAPGRGILPPMSPTSLDPTHPQALRRTGPRPLSVHLGMAACAWGLPPGEGGGAGDSTGLPSAPGVSDRMLRMLAGIRKYHEHPYARLAPPREVVWSQGSMRLLHAPARKGRGGTRACVFLIPSLINGSDILDLIPEHSFVAWLADRGISSFLLDWGDLAADAQASDFESLFSTRLLPAFDAALAARRGEGLHVLGYCMGGILAAALAGLREERVRSLTLLATPWDFHAGDQTLSTRVRLWSSGARSMTHSLGRLPVDWLQILFASVDPPMSAHKFVTFADAPDDSPAARIFVGVEDWLNGGSDLPAEIARICIEDWYGENRTALGTWCVQGRKVDPAGLAAPALIVASATDRLVPRESSVAFAARRKPESFRILTPPCGHIGMMASRACVAEVWEPIARWMERAGP
jgi:polyhydroxyalkanoate synthase